MYFPSLKEKINHSATPEQTNKKRTNHNNKPTHMYPKKNQQQKTTNRKMHNRRQKSALQLVVSIINKGIYLDKNHWIFIGKEHNH